MALRPTIPLEELRKLNEQSQQAAAARQPDKPAPAPKPSDDRRR